METFWQDLKYAARTLGKKPAFTLVAALTLALGIGANATIFSLTNALLLRPLPATQPQELLRLVHVGADGRAVRAHSYLNYIDLRDQNDVFSGLIASHQTPALLGTSDKSVQILAEVVSENYFSLLGTRAALGRRFTAGDPDSEVPGIVVSFAFWQRRFGGEPGIVGRNLMVNGHPLVVIGVAPKDFPGLIPVAPTDVWVPVRLGHPWIGANVLQDRNTNRFMLIARLKPGVTAEVAQADMTTIAARLEQAYPETNRGEKVQVAPARALDGALRTAVSLFLAVLSVVVGVVLLIVCSNLANLFLVRATGRRQELAIRLALGASRGRLLRHLLTESVLLGLLGGSIGLLLSVWGSQLLAQFNPLPDSIPIRIDFSPDLRVLWFTLLASVLAGVLTGLAPALQSIRPQLLTALKDEGRGSSGGPGTSRMRDFFVGAQVALSLLLMITAGLFLRSLQNAGRMDLGFDTAHAIALDLDLKSRDWTEEKEQRFYRELVERVKALPGVQSAAMANLAPLDLATGRVGIVVEGRPLLPGKDSFPVSFNPVSPGYFETLRIPLLAGRDFTERDDSGAPDAVIINETMARTFWPQGSAMGKRFRVVTSAGAMGTHEVEVIGIARNVKYRTLGEDPEPHLYLPYLQNHVADRTLLVRSTGDPGAGIATVQGVIQSLDPGVQGFFARTLIQHAAFSLLPARMSAALSAAFGLLALLLATIGIYGVVAYTVTQRTREIGIRMTLGAQRGDVMRLVIGRALQFVGAGAGIGIASALLLTRAVRSLLYGVNAADPVSIGGATLILVGIAVLACWIPARRATRVDPMVALRYE